MWCERLGAGLTREILSSETGFLAREELHLRNSSSNLQTPVDSGSISGPSRILILSFGFMFMQESQVGRYRGLERLNDDFIADVPAREMRGVESRWKEAVTVHMTQQMNHKSVHLKSFLFLGGES